MNLVETAKELLQIYEDFPYASDKYELITFKQIWPDMSGGFQSTITQDALITQRTYVLFSCDKTMPHYVYFGSKFAYKVAYGDKTFEADVRENNVVGCKDAIDRYRVI